MNQDNYIKKQAWRSKPGEYKSVRPRVLDAADWLEGMIPGGVGGKTILDLGTRDGWALDLYEERGATETAGLELVPRVAKYAKRRGRNVRAGDMHKFEHFDCEWDIVIALHSLEHCHTPAAAMNQIYRRIRPGGWCYIVVPKEEWNPGKDRSHFYFFPKMSNLMAFMGAWDFEDIKTAEPELINNRGKLNTELRFLGRKPHASS